MKVLKTTENGKENIQGSVVKKLPKISADIHALGLKLGLKYEELANAGIEEKGE